MRLHGIRFQVALIKEKYVIGALTTTLPMMLYFFGSSGGGGHAKYGLDLLSRILSLRLEQVRLSGGADAIIGLLLSLALWGAVFWTVWLISKRAANIPQRRIDAMIMTIAALAASVFLLLIFPDSLGGGWTHARRLSSIPAYWIVVLMAFHAYTSNAKLALAVVAGIATVILLGTTLSRELKVRDQARSFASIDEAVGVHCTLLPIVFESRPLDLAGAPMRISYGPYFQLANNLELTKDRVVLFNYLARLDAYPVKYRPKYEPQANIFLWADQYEGMAIEHVDIRNFERTSGLHVDYLMVFGEPLPHASKLREQLNVDVAGAILVYEDPRQNMRLYRRPLNGTTRSRCSLNSPAER